MLDWGLDFLGGLASFAQDPAGAIAGWTFDKVTSGIFEWLARGLALMIEWVWRILDAGSTPRLTEDWFRNELAGQLGVIALSVTVAMMLASAAQAALAGRPDQIGDTVKEAARAIVASAFTVSVVDLMVRLVDEISTNVWLIGRSDLVTMLERMVFLSTSTGLLGATFVGPFCLLFGFIGLLGITVSLGVRSTLIYVAAALAPLVWSSSVLPILRGASRRLVHLLVALIVSKLAIVITLVVAIKLAANTGGDPDTAGADADAAAAVGTLLTGFVAFLVAAVTPMVLYRLMPTVEGAVAASGVVGSWGRSLLSTGQAAMMAKSGLGAAAASTAVAGQGGVPGAGPAGESAPAGPAAGAGPAQQQAPGTSPATGGSGQQGAGGNLPPLPPTPGGGGSSTPAGSADPGGGSGGGSGPPGGPPAGPGTDGGPPPLPRRPRPASPPSEPASGSGAPGRPAQGPAAGMPDEGPSS